jgi:hypothetical protein
MGGLTIKELKFRGLVERTLIVTPANLTDEWRQELHDKFNETFTVINRGTVSATYGRNVWEDNPQCITSIDFVARQDDILNLLRDVRWDLVIVEEAHKMAAYRYGTKVNKTQRYEFGEFLRDRTDHYLFLTATPHKGDPDNFALGDGDHKKFDTIYFNEKAITIDQCEVTESAWLLRPALAKSLMPEAKPVVVGTETGSGTGTTGDTGGTTEGGGWTSGGGGVKIVKGERRLNKVRIDMESVPWEHWNDVYNEVIDPLVQEGADLHCQVIVIAQGDAAIRENTLELGIKESLSQRGIKADIQTG